MSSFDLSTELSDFSGFAPLFPLPNAVVYPHILQPLHIFEPRYIEMISNALAEDRLIAMAVLKPGWEINPGPRPEVYSTICIGRITAEELLPNGRYNLMLQGLQRGRIVTEEDFSEPYRRAKIDLLTDDMSGVEWSWEKPSREELLQRFRKLFPSLEIGHELYQIFESEISLGILCDVLAYALRLPTSVGMELLAEERVRERCDHLLNHLRNLSANPAVEITREFPPKFSLN